MLTILLKRFAFFLALALLVLAALAVILGNPWIVALCIGAFWAAVRADDIADELARAWAWLTMPSVPEALDWDEIGADRWRDDYLDRAVSRWAT